MSRPRQPQAKPTFSARLPTWRAACSRFLWAEVDALPLRLFEIWMAAAYLLRLPRNFPVAEWLTEEGFHLTSAEWQQLGYPPAFPLLPLWGAWLFLAASLAAALLLAASLRWRRLALAALFGSALYVQGADYATAFSGNKEFIAVFFLLATGPGIRLGAGSATVCAVTLRAMQATLLVIYLTAGWAKCHPGTWLTHPDTLYTLIQGFHRTDAAAWALRNLPMWMWTAMQYTTLFFEVFAPLLIGWRRLRPLGFLLGIGMHLMIALFMKNLIYFSIHMIGYYTLFITAEQWRGAALWGKRLGKDKW